MEPDNIGQFVAIDVQSGDYEVAAEQLDAINQLETRRPDTQVYIHRVGHDYAFRAVGFKVIDE